MKNSTIKEIQSLFETGEIETIKFSKTGKVSVKYVKEPYIIQHTKIDNVIEEIKEYAEIYKSLEKVVKKPASYTCEGTFTLPSGKQAEMIERLCDLGNESIINIEVNAGSFKVVENTDQESKNKGLFERFYDAVGKWLGGGKSFAPDECKTFA